MKSIINIIRYERVFHETCDICLSVFRAERARRDKRQTLRCAFAGWPPPESSKCRSSAHARAIGQWRELFNLFTIAMALCTVPVSNQRRTRTKDMLILWARKHHSGITSRQVGHYKHSNTSRENTNCTKILGARRALASCGIVLVTTIASNFESLIFWSALPLKTPCVQMAYTLFAPASSSLSAAWQIVPIRTNASEGDIRTRTVYLRCRIEEHCSEWEIIWNNRQCSELHACGWSRVNLIVKYEYRVRVLESNHVLS